MNDSFCFTTEERRILRANAAANRNPGPSATSQGSAQMPLVPSSNNRAAPTAIETRETSGGGSGGIGGAPSVSRGGIGGDSLGEV